MDLEKVQVFPFYKSDLMKWTPELAKVIFSEQQQYAELVRTGSLGMVQDYSPYMCYLSAERLAFVVLKGLFNVVFEKMSGIIRLGQEARSESFHSIPMAELVNRVASEVAKEVQYNYDFKLYEQHIQKVQLSKKEVSLLMKEVKDRLAEKKEADSKDYLERNNDIIPFDMKIKLAEVLLFYCRLPGSRV